MLDNIRFQIILARGYFRINKLRTNSQNSAKNNNLREESKIRNQEYSKVADASQPEKADQYVVKDRCAKSFLTPYLLSYT